MSTAEIKNVSTPLNGLKWVVSILLLVAIVVGNYLYGEQVHLVLRVSILIALAVLALFIASLTDKGRTFVGFAQDSRLEVRKVVWPTRQETVQTSGKQ
jgi:preprotein translocase subunit SecE